MGIGRKEGIKRREREWERGRGEGGGGGGATLTFYPDFFAFVFVLLSYYTPTRRPVHELSNEKLLYLRTKNIVPYLALPLRVNCEGAV